MSAGKVAPRNIGLDILADKYQKLDTNKDVLEFCLFPILLYGAQTWSHTEKEKRMLQSCQRKVERSMLHVVWSDRVTNAELRRRTNRKGIVAVAHSVKWKWGGHVARTDQCRWAHAVSRGGGGQNGWQK
jgi:hypothetical protein